MKAEIKATIIIIEPGCEANMIQFNGDPMFLVAVEKVLNYHTRAANKKKLSPNKLLQEAHKALLAIHQQETT